MNFNLHKQVQNDQYDSLPYSLEDTLTVRDDIVAIYDVLNAVYTNRQMFSSFAIADILEEVRDMPGLYADNGKDSLRGIFRFNEEIIDYGNAIELLIEAINDYYESEESDESLIANLTSFDVVQRGLRSSSLTIFDSEYELPDEVKAIVDPMDLHIVALVTPQERCMELVTLAASVLFVVRYDDEGQTRFPMEHVIAFTEAINKGKQVLVLELGRPALDTKPQYEGGYIKGNVVYFAGEDSLQNFHDYLMCQAEETVTMEPEEDDESE